MVSQMKTAVHITVPQIKKFLAVFFSIETSLIKCTEFELSI
jgi:hypothetical protein